MSAKPVTIFLLILVAILTVSTSYLYSKDKAVPAVQVTPVNTNSPELKSEVEGVETENTVPVKTTDEISEKTTEKTTETTATEDGEASPLVNKNRASNPEKAYLVKTGETLYPIGLKYELDWTIIAKANGLSDSNNIQAGVVIVIPDYDTDTKKIEINYKIDETKSATLEKNISQGKDLWRQDPVQVASRESYPCFKLSKTDAFTLGSKNDEKGIAQVSAVKDDISYEIGLVQPLTKGAEGIWTISYIKEI